jgi:hypothetical protein
MTAIVSVAPQAVDQVLAAAGAPQPSSAVPAGIFPNPTAFTGHSALGFLQPYRRDTGDPGDPFLPSEGANVPTRVRFFLFLFFFVFFCYNTNIYLEYAIS